MKNIKYLLTFAATAVLLSSCFKTPDEYGFIGENIYLQGGDTLYVAIGAAKSTEKAWLDNSTKPVTFKIENVRDEDGNRHEGFFTKFPTRLWNNPYDYTVDTTEAQVLEKLTYFDMTPLMINETNGQLRAMESTSLIDIQPGDVYHVDVSATNPKGTRYIEDYAIIKFEKGTTAEDFVCTELINGIAIANQYMTSAGKLQDVVIFPYYEQVNDTKSNWADLQDKIYAGEEVQGMKIERTDPNSPSVGIKLILKFLDKNGKLFDPALYSTYSTGTTSFLTHGVNRQNTEEGMVVEFPYTPWPVTSEATHLGYMKGPVYSSFNNVDMAAIKAAFPTLRQSNSYAWPSKDSEPDLESIFYDANGNAIWPTGWFEENGKSWYVRLRSRFKFYQPGTYTLTVKVPYVTVD